MEEQPNPYSIDEPAEDLFYGRQDSVDQIAAALMALRGRSYALIGGRRFGKTSFLYALERAFLHALSSRKVADVLGCCVIPVYVNLLGSHVRDWPDFLALSANLLCTRVLEAAPGLLPKKIVAEASMPHTAEQSTLDLFATILIDVCTAVREQWGPTRVVLLVDETEGIRNRRRRETLFGHLRWLISDNRSTNTQLKIVLAGSSDFYEDIKQKTSPLSGVLRPVFLNAFSEEASLRLIQEPCGGRIPDGSARLIVHLSGGHPFIIQYIMRELWERGLTAAQVDEIRLIADGLKAEDWHFTRWKKAMGKPAQQVYLVLSQHEDWVAAREIREHLGTVPELIPALRALCYHGFAIHDGTWQRYKLVGGLFREWFLAGMDPGIEPSGYLGQSTFPDLRASDLQGGLPQEDDIRPAEVETALIRGQTLRSTELVSPTEIRQRYAVLIGVHDYSDPSYRALPHTIPDVLELEKTLVQAGYTVRILHSDQPNAALQPTRENIWGELENLTKQTGPGDLLLVHFGGHGDLDGGHAYLVPANGRKGSLRKTAIDLDELKKVLAEASAQARILFLDACHSGIGRDAAGMDTEFERHVYLEATGTATLASCRHGEVAHEHDQGSHGAFTYYLLEGMRGAAAHAGQRFVTFDDLKKYVTHTVKKWAISQGWQQQPNASTQLVGDPPLIELPSLESESLRSLHFNPFTAIDAIDDPACFIGRETELRRLRTMLQGGSVAILGDPKIGKSSLLHRLGQLLREVGQVVIFWSFFAPGDVEQLVTEAIRELGATGTGWEALEQAASGRRVIFLLDEFDVAPERGVDVDCLRKLRFLCEAPRTRLRVTTASRIAPRDLFPDTGRGSPPYNFLQPFNLGRLAESEALHLLTHPWMPNAMLFAEATCRELLELSVRHPFRLQRAAFHRYEALGDAGYDWQAAYRQDVEQML